jgi:2',3'-cyclic-nucleotide 2'-phosphodiesterase (5'-nucleotidase family)
MKTQYGQVMLVDGGGFFPEVDTHQDVASFLMDAMKVLGTDAVTAGDKELRWGPAYLKYHIKRTALPVVSANMLDKLTGKPLLQPYVIKKVGNAKVGVFGLMSDKVDLGRSQDSVKVEEPSAAARRTVAELRKKGATVVVLLSQLGKVESEDLAAAITGIDAVIVGRNVPMIQKGRMIKNTVACYGGEQGQYASSTRSARRPPSSSGRRTRITSSARSCASAATWTRASSGRRPRTRWRGRRWSTSRRTRPRTASRATSWASSSRAGSRARRTWRS